MISKTNPIFKIFNVFLTILLFGSVFVIACVPKPEDYQPKVLDEARKWKSKIESDIQVAVEDTRKIAASLKEKESSGIPSQDSSNLIKKILGNHEDYLAVWLYCEPNAFGNYDIKYQNILRSDESGRFLPCWTRKNGQLTVIPLNSCSNDEQDTFCQMLIKSDREMASDPIEYSLDGKKELKIIYAVPFHFEGKIIGVVGLDLPLFKFFTPIIRQVRVLDVAYGFLIANNGLLTAHPIKWANVGRSLEFFGFEPEVIQAVKDGREATQLKVSKTTGQKNYYQFVPIQIGASNRPWSLAISLIPEWLNGRGPKVTW